MDNKTDNFFRLTGSLLLAITLFIALLLVTSCKKEESREETRSEGPVVNPYSSESVYMELKKKLDQNPNDADALYHLADLYDRDAQYAEAIETYKKVVKLRPKMGYAYLKMGTAYDRINKPTEAIDTLKKAARHMPNNAVVYNNLGIAYGKSGKMNEEIEALKKAIRLRPNYSTARYNLGVTYLKVGNRKSAIREYEALEKFDEGVAKALKKEIDKSSQ